MLQVIQSPGACPEYALNILCFFSRLSKCCALPRLIYRLGRTFRGHHFIQRRSNNCKLLFTHPSMKGIVISSNQPISLHSRVETTPFWYVSRKASQLSLKLKPHFGFYVKPQFCDSFPMAWNPVPLRWHSRTARFV